MTYHSQCQTIPLHPHSPVTTQSYPCNLQLHTSLKPFTRLNHSCAGQTHGGGGHWTSSRTYDDMLTCGTLAAEVLFCAVSRNPVLEFGLILVSDFLRFSLKTRQSMMRTIALGTHRITVFTQVALFQAGKTQPKLFKLEFSITD